MLCTLRRLQAHHTHHALPPLLFRKFMSRFTLERESSRVLHFSHRVTHGHILLKWLERNQGAMADTVHLAIVAGTITVLGLHILFSSFLLNMMKTDD